MLQFIAAVFITIGQPCADRRESVCMTDQVRGPGPLAVHAGDFDVDIKVSLPSGQQLLGRGQLVRQVELDGSFLKETFTHNMSRNLARIVGYSFIDKQGRLVTTLFAAGSPGTTTLRSAGPARDGPAAHVGLTDCLAGGKSSTLALEWGAAVDGVRTATLKVSQADKGTPVEVKLTIRRKKS